MLVGADQGASAFLITHFATYYIQLLQLNVYWHGQCNAIRHTDVSLKWNNPFRNDTSEGSVQFFWLKIDPPFEPLELINYPIVIDVCSIKRDHSQQYSIPSPPY
jgi:hypothetical protein